MAHYQLPESVAMPVPSLTGRFLAHNRHSRVDRAFFAADLFFGAKRLTMPTLVQAALLAGVNRTYAFWATKPQAQRTRTEIEAGLVPLVPAAPARNNGNGTVRPLVPDGGIDDAQLMHIASLVGVDRMLAAAIAAGH
ncbi:MAG: hypothetical protein WAV38_32415 [Xanthobacteraceae bacterium]